MKRFWNFAKSNTGTGSLTLYGEISDFTWFGDEVTPKAFKDELEALGSIQRLDIFINSPGGDVFAGFAIYNMIARHPAQKIAYIDGLAASIASIIAMAADRIVMPRNAMMMIHNSSTRIVGNKDRLRKVADEMERIDNSLISIYAARTGKTPEEIAPLLDEETWFTGAEAVDAGFADELEETKSIAACLCGEKLHIAGLVVDLARYRNLKKMRECVPENGHTHQILLPPPSRELAAIQPHTYIYTLEPENGGEGQPVSDNSALESQRKRFKDIKIKILEGNCA